jgi:hypothetical protein
MVLSEPPVSWQSLVAYSQTLGHVALYSRQAVRAAFLWYQVWGVSLSLQYPAVFEDRTHKVSRANVELLSSLSIGFVPDEYVRWMRLVPEKLHRVVLQ